MSMAYHPQTDGPSECTNQTLEDMLRGCVIDFGGSCDTHLPLAEFSYNNSYHSSVRCAPFKALYGRKCRSPVLWAKIGENRLVGPELVQETTDKVILIKERLKTVRDCQNSYVGNRPKQLGFEVGDKVILEVLSWKGEKYLADSNLYVPIKEIKVNKTLCFVEEPVEIIDREVKSLKRSRVPIVKVHSNSKRGHENFMKTKYSVKQCEATIVVLAIVILLICITMFRPQAFATAPDTLCAIVSSSMSFSKFFFSVTLIASSSYKSSSTEGDVLEGRGVSSKVTLSDSLIFLGLEVGSIRHIQGIGYGVLKFLGVGTTFDIFQNIHILYLEYGVLTSSGYGVLIFFPLWSLVSAGTDTSYLP
ncbi:putative reverse transcriptase domain-containing protein [Tanacetum coccineum]|uniref:Reverse transcriptase domain-containing protein n=1 Tax=Tanacetum coccineum TaxID=301880 RepID=A0ABQ5HRQ7_9ASTR